MLTTKGLSPLLMVAARVRLTKHNPLLSARSKHKPISHLGFKKGNANVLQPPLAKASLKWDSRRDPRGTHGLTVSVNCVFIPVFLFDRVILIFADRNQILLLAERDI